MDASRTSLELLAHFESAAAPVRGAPWVLKWTATAGVLFYAACVLLQFWYCIVAERTLTHAARAGALEATLPRATRETIVATVQRRLLSNSITTAGLRIDVRQNDAPMQRDFQLTDDDRVIVSLSLPANAVLPAWLNTAACWGGTPTIEARAARRTPSRHVRTLP
jgi:hypothetical protein